MPNYCTRCRRVIEEARCLHCKCRKVREVAPDDPCFLTETEWIWSEMLADVLKQNCIPYQTKNALGAGVTVKIGLAKERVRFYVYYRQLDEAKEIVNALFSTYEEPDGEPTV